MRCGMASTLQPLQARTPQFEVTNVLCGIAFRVRRYVFVVDVTGARSVVTPLVIWGKSADEPSSTSSLASPRGILDGCQLDIGCGPAAVSRADARATRELTAFWITWTAFWTTRLAGECSDSSSTKGASTVRDPFLRGPKWPILDATFLRVCATESVRSRSSTLIPFFSVRWCSRVGLCLRQYSRFCAANAAKFSLLMRPSPSMSSCRK